MYRADKHGVANVAKGNLIRNIKFIVKVSRGSTHSAIYVKRIDRSPIEMTKHRSLALTMGRFTAEDAANSIQNSRHSPELVPVRVVA